MIDVAQCLRIAARVAREKPAAFEPASQRALWEVMYPYFRPARPANGDDADAGVFSVAPLPAVRGAGLALASHAVPGVGVIGARIPPPVSLDSTEPACVVPFVLPAGIRHSDRFSCPVWRSNDTVVLAVTGACPDLERLERLRRHAAAQAAAVNADADDDEPSAADEEARVDICVFSSDGVLLQRLVPALPAGITRDFEFVTSPNGRYLVWFEGRVAHVVSRCVLLHCSPSLVATTGARFFVV